MILMTYKTVSLNEKAFALLRNAKKENESYSEVIIRILNKPDLSTFLSLAGSLKNDISNEEMDDFIKEARSAWN